MKQFFVITVVVLTLFVVSISSRIFTNKSRTNFTQSSTQTATIVAMGDIMLGRTVNVKASQYNYLWAFKNTNDLLSSADITLANLESPLGENCPLTNTGMVFCGDTQHTEGLKYAGIDIVNLANNHGTDQGKEGVRITKSILDAQEIDYIGGKEQPLFKVINGITFAFLGYNTVFPVSDELIWGYEETIRNEVENINDEVDHVVVTIHWGNEYTTSLTPLQRRLAHTAIDAGADIIIGHHPHWVQKNELYKGKPVYYSLGNFIFDQMWSQKTREGLVIKATFDNNTILGIDHIPIIVEDYGQPRLATEEEGGEILTNSEIQPLFP